MLAGKYMLRQGKHVDDLGNVIMHQAALKPFDDDLP